MKRWLSALMLVWASVICGYAQGGRLPSVIELVSKNDSALNPVKLVALCKQYHIPARSVYSWKNHLAVYAHGTGATALRKRIALQYPQARVRFYARPFYNFERKYCSSQSVAEEWDDILLTANLVQNPKLQKQYLNYHATQFRKWPEVAQGFCHANFQQLLVFHNGRRLMLVISIPKGASLDDLNPKTIEHNPRGVQWNNIMKRYQEGVPGTRPGEVWVFLKPVTLQR